LRTFLKIDRDVGTKLAIFIYWLLLSESFSDRQGILFCMSNGYNDSGKDKDTLKT